jgi:hypothetical protein
VAVKLHWQLTLCHADWYKDEKQGKGTLTTSNGVYTGDFLNDMVLLSPRFASDTLRWP